MDTFHVTLATEERTALCSSNTDRVRAAASVTRTCGRELLLFCVVDDHVHLVLRGTAKRVGQLAGNVSQSLRRSGTPLDRARIRPVSSRSHLRTLVRYVLDQTTHHTLSTAPHPALWPGSSFWDLVGARAMPGFGATPLREALPRLTSDDVWGAVGLPALEPESGDGTPPTPLPLGSTPDGPGSPTGPPTAWPTAVR